MRGLGSRSSPEDIERWALKLAARLKNADFEFASLPADSKVAAYIEALGSVVNALNDLPGMERPSVALDDLLLKLTDVAAGSNALHPAPRTGRPRQGQRDAIIQGRAAGLVDWLIAQGESEPKACEIIAKALAKAGMKGRRGSGVTLATVRDWRSRSDSYGDKAQAAKIRDHVRGTMMLNVPPGTLPRSEAKRLASVMATDAESSLEGILIKSPLSDR